MILSVHAIFGAAVASLVPNHPVIGFGLGFVSHFVLDAIPHRDYELISVDCDYTGKAKPIDLIMNKFKLIRDVLLASFDALVGLCLAFLFFFDQVHPWLFLAGALGALLPDGIVFLYLLLQHKSLNYFFNFHCHFDSDFNKRLKQKIGQVTGVIFQFITVSILIVLVFGLKAFLVE